MPLSIAEAMGCGKPVVSTDVGDISWMVCEDNRRLVVPGDSDPCYTDALRELVRDEDLRRSLGEQNRARTVELFDRQMMIDNYRELFRRLVKQPRAPAASL